LNLREKGLNGIFWTFGHQFGAQIIQFGVSVVLARVLMPEEFGLLGMLAIFMALGNSLIDSGMSLSLIRTNNVDEKDFSTVFFINVIVSVLVYSILFITSTAIADFFKQPILVEVVKVYCLSFIISAFSSVQFTRLTILLDFKSQAVIKIPALIISSFVGLFLAFNGFGVWSLVYMQLAQVFFETLFIWIKEKWRPSFEFDYNRFKYHFNFGYKLTLSGIINTFFDYIYHIIIGKYFSAAQLGYYTRADSIKQLPVNNISTALNKVTFPLFSSIQDDAVRLKSLYKKLMQQVLFWIAPILLIAAALGEPLFRFLLTDKWLPAVPYFQILCLVGIMYPIHAYNLNILNVKGRSDLFLKLEIIKKIITVIGFIIAIQFGIYGLLWLQFVLSLLSFFINTFYSGKLINYSFIEQVKDIIPILLIASFSGFIVFVVDGLYSINVLSDFTRILVGGILGIGIYALSSSIFNLTALKDFKYLILKK
jgi:teichuronic acid exporter